jgi:hypothetical protein
MVHRWFVGSRWVNSLPVVVEVQGHPSNSLGLIAFIRGLDGQPEDECLGVAWIAVLKTSRGEGESVLERVFRGLDLVERMFVLGELLDHGEDVRDIFTTVSGVPLGILQCQDVPSVVACVIVTLVGSAMVV